MLFSKTCSQFPAMLVQDLVIQEAVSLYLAMLFFASGASVFSSPCHDILLNLQCPVASTFTGQLLAVRTATFFCFFRVFLRLLETV